MRKNPGFTILAGVVLVPWLWATTRSWCKRAREQNLPRSAASSSLRPAAADSVGLEFKSRPCVGFDSKSQWLLPDFWWASVSYCRISMRSAFAKGLKSADGLLIALWNKSFIERAKTSMNFNNTGHGKCNPCEQSSITLRVLSHRAGESSCAKDKRNRDLPL